MADWLQHYPAIRAVPPMIRYTPQLLQAGPSAVGLTVYFVDGIYAWRAIDQWPTGRLRRLAGGALQRLIPLPRAIRLRWGIHLIAMGRKA